jgi:hypothetical protein
MSAERAFAAEAALRPDGLIQRAGVVPGVIFGSCRVLAVGSDEAGAVIVVLQGRDGRRFMLDLLGHDDHIPGVASAGSLAIYVNNNGAGDMATDEEHGLAAMALAKHLAKRQAAGVKLPVLPTLSDRRHQADRT